MRSDKNIPALKKLSHKATLNQIFFEVDAIFKNDAVVARNIKLYLSQKYSGKSLKEISAHFGIGESGVSQACRRTAEKIKKKQKLRKQIGKIEKKLKLSRMKT